MFKGTAPNPMLFKDGRRVNLNRQGSPKRSKEKADLKHSSASHCLPPGALFLRGRALSQQRQASPKYLSLRDTEGKRAPSPKPKHNGKHTGKLALRAWVSD